MLVALVGEPVHDVAESERVVGQALRLLQGVCQE